MQDPRHTQRIKAVQNLFAYSFNTPDGNIPYSDNTLSPAVISQKEKIDTFIQQFAPKYPIDRIAKTDLAVLRLAVYELIIAPEQPQKVVIDEAVKLAKEFGGERSFAFVNAVLGAIVKSEKHEH
jgi:N utilization substance protein B